MVNKIKVSKINVNEIFCKGCGICIEMCPKDVLSPSKKLSKRGVYYPIVVDLESCSGCRLCEIYCCDFAIAVERGDENDG